MYTILTYTWVYSVYQCILDYTSDLKQFSTALYAQAGSCLDKMLLRNISSKTRDLISLYLSLSSQKTKMDEQSGRKKKQTLWTEETMLQGIVSSVPL